MNASVPPETCVSEWEEGTEGGAEGGREGGMVGRTKSLVMSWLFARAQVSEYQRSQAQHRVFVRARIPRYIHMKPLTSHAHAHERAPARARAHPHESLYCNRGSIDSSAILS